jgi:tetratricopeptide (TPR) repeat protein
MPGHRMSLFALTALVMVSCFPPAAGKTWRLKKDRQWEPVTASPDERYAHAVARLKRVVQSGDAEAADERVEELKAQFPERVRPDLDLFVEGELLYWTDKYAKAMVKYEKLFEDYPGSEFADLVLQREWAIGQAYLEGRKKTVLGFIRIAGYAEGVEIMERISDRAGLDEPESIGLTAAVSVAEHYERREQYLEAYLKWSEIASYYDAGPIGRKATLRMAENNLLAYDQAPEGRRHLYDASKLRTARTYYDKLVRRYPDEARQHDAREKIDVIDEKMAYKQYTIGQYYERTDKRRAAYLYYDMVVRNWPKTEAAELARQAIQRNRDEAAGGAK